MLFQRLGSRGDPVKYEELCQALRGAGEFITLRKIYRILDLRLVRPNRGVCDIRVQDAHNPPGAVSLSAGQ